MIDTILVDRKGYRFKGDFFHNYEGDLLMEKIKKNRRIIMLEEPLLVKITPILDSSIPIEKIIDEIIEKEFSRYSQLLFHYERDKKNNRVFLYAIKNALAVNKLLEGAQNVEVIPIQKLITKIITNKYKNLKDYIFIIEVDKFYYLINVENNHIVNAEVKKDLLEVRNSIDCSERNKNIIVDNNIKEKISIQNENCSYDKVINIGEVIHEKLFTTQKFYIRGFLKGFSKEKREKRAI